jgi:transposase
MAMASQSRTSTLQERIEIGERSDAGQTDPGIAQAMGRSVWTIRKWRRGWRQQGRGGLASKMGRPPGGPLAQFSAEVQEAIRQLRKEHAGWGPETLRVELTTDPRFEHMGRMPGRSQIAAFLKQEGLTRKYERHSELPQPSVKAAQQAHEEWEMDAKGVMQVSSAGKVSLINLCDVFTTLKVDSFPCMHTSKPKLLDYQLLLRRAFLKWGLPQRLALDHDSVFYDNTSASPYPTTFHLWLIALEVEVTFGRKGRPTDQATVERSHQTLTQQAILGQDLPDKVAIQQALDNRLDFLAYRFPSRSLNHQPPLVAHPEAVHSGRAYHPQWEWDLLDLERVYRYLAQCRWFRQVSAQGQFSLGSYRYGIGTAFAGQQVEITFDPETQEFVCCSEDASQKVRLPAQGLTKQNLMGELGPLVALPAYQLALPFSLDEWRTMCLCADLDRYDFVGLCPA